MANNKVVLGDETLIDLTSDTATEETVLEGYTFHSADGQLRTGLAIAGGGDDKMDIDGENADSSVTFPNSALTIGSRASEYTINTLGFNWENLTIKGHLPVNGMGPNGGTILVYHNKIHLLYGTYHYSYDNVNNIWILESTIPYNFRGQKNAALVYDDKIWIFGNVSTDSSASANRTLYYWDDTYRSWSLYAYAPQYISFYINAEFSTVVYNGYIYFFCTNYVYKFSASNGFQKLMTHGIIPPDSNMVCLVYNNKIHMLGGGSSENTQKQHYSWNGEVNENPIEESTLPLKLDGISNMSTYGSAIVCNNKIYIFGGINDPDGCYSWDGNSWTQEINLPHDFMYGYAINYNNNIHLLGGGSSYNTITIDHYYSISPYSEWVELKDSLPYNFSYGAAVVYDNKIHIFGGTNTNNTAHYSWNGSNWVQESTLPDALSRCSAVVYNNKIHLLAGTSHYVWDGNTWTTKATLPCSIGSCNSSVVVWNDRIYVTGFYNNSSYNNKIYYYTDSSNSWTADSDTRVNVSWTDIVIVYKNKIHLLIGSSKTHYVYGEYSARSNLPYNFCCAAAVVYNDTLYILGGATNTTSGTTVSKNCYYWDDQKDIWIPSTILPYNFFKSCAISYNNKIYIMGGLEDISSDYNPINNFYSANQSSSGEAIEILIEKPKTMVLGSQSIADGNYSYARGNNCAAIGDYSKAEGINAYALNNFQSVFKGSSNKFGNDEFAFGHSLFNNVFTHANDENSMIDATYGYSGTLFPDASKGSSSTYYYFKIDFSGMYIMCRGSIEKGCTLNMIACGATFQSGGSGTGSLNLHDTGLYFYISVPYKSKGIQFVLIRLA